jgi:hypothetical protein
MIKGTSYENHGGVSHSFWQALFLLVVVLAFWAVLLALALLSSL